MTPEVALQQLEPYILFEANRCASDIAPAVDLAQEARLVALTALTRWNGNDPWPTYAICFIKGAIKRYYRDKASIIRISGYGYERGIRPPKNFLNVEDTQVKYIDFNINNISLKIDINRAMSKLPDRYKKVLFMKFWLEMEDSEIANVLHKSIDTVSRYIKDAKKAIGKYMANSELGILPQCKADLTPREKEILNKFVEFDTTNQVANSLYISNRTVQFHLDSIYKKLNVHSLHRAMLAVGHYLK